jgi:hypothetical protein
VSRAADELANANSIMPRLARTSVPKVGSGCQVGGRGAGVVADAVLASTTAAHVARSKRMAVVVGAHTRERFEEDS